MTPEMLARYFHMTYEKLAPGFGYQTRDDTKAFDPKTPNGRLMVAVAREALRGPLTLPARLAKADVLRGRICRVVCFGVADEDLQMVLDLCERLDREALDRAAAELDELTRPDDEPRPAGPAITERQVAPEAVRPPPSPGTLCTCCKTAQATQWGLAGEPFCFTCEMPF